LQQLCAVGEVRGYWYRSNGGGSFLDGGEGQEIENAARKTTWYSKG
jgi:hypothetical protein